MHITNLHDAKAHLSRLVDRAAAGEEIVIAKAGKPLVRMVPFRASDRPRRSGYWRGRVNLAEDFDASPEGMLALFEGGPGEAAS